MVATTHLSFEVRTHKRLIHLRILTKIGVGFDRFIGVLALVAGVLLCVVTLMIVIDVTMRYLFSNSLLWVKEGAEFGQLFFALLGATWVLKRKEHISIDLVINLLKPRSQARLNIATSILGAIICWVVTWWSGQLAWELFQEGVYVVGIIEPPKGVFLALIAIVYFLLSIQFLRNTYGYIKTQGT